MKLFAKHHLLSSVHRLIYQSGLNIIFLPFFPDSEPPSNQSLSESMAPMKNEDHRVSNPGYDDTDVASRTLDDTSAAYHYSEDSQRTQEPELDFTDITVKQELEDACNVDNEEFSFAGDSFTGEQQVYPTSLPLAGPMSSDNALWPAQVDF